MEKKYNFALVLGSESFPLFQSLPCGITFSCILIIQFLNTYNLIIHRNRGNILIIEFFNKFDIIRCAQFLSNLSKMFFSSSFILKPGLMQLFKNLKISTFAKNQNAFKSKDFLEHFCSELQLQLLAVLLALSFEKMMEII